MSRFIFVIFISGVSSIMALVGYSISSLNVVDRSEYVSEATDKILVHLDALLDENLYASEPLSVYSLVLEYMVASESSEPIESLRTVMISELSDRYAAMEVYCASQKEGHFKETCNNTLENSQRLVEELS